MKPDEFTLGPWLVRPALNELESSDARVHLEPKAMQTLTVLADRAGDVVSKEEILARVWPDTFVSEGTIFRVIAELRHALGDTAADGRFIVTIPKQGYRLAIAPVPVSRRAPEPRANAAVPAPAAARTARRWIAAAVLTTAIVVWLTTFHGPFGARPSGLVMSAEARESISVAELWEHRVDCDALDRARTAYGDAIAAHPDLIDARHSLFDTVTAAAVLGCLAPASAERELAATLADLQPWRNQPGTIRRRAAFALWFDAGAAHEPARLFATATIARQPDVNRAALLISTGHVEESIQEARAALALEPAALGENWTLGMTLFLARRFGDAAIQFDRTLALYEGSPIASSLAALSALRAGRTEEAIAAAGRVAWRPGRPMDRFTAIPALIFAEAGRLRDRDRVIAEWQAAAATQSYLAPTARAIVALSRNDLAGARAGLEEARRLGDPWTVLLSIDPTFDALRRREARQEVRCSSRRFSASRSF